MTRDRQVIVALVVAAAVAMVAVFAVAYVQTVGKQQQRVDQAYCATLAAKGMTDPARC